MALPKIACSTELSVFYGSREVGYGSREGTSDFRLQISDFRLQTLVRASLIANIAFAKLANI
jgi:hypothetical protein